MARRKKFWAKIKRSTIWLGGKIKKVIEDRGFGFIAADDGREIFFHMSALQGISLKDLKEGDPVEFDVEEGPHGRGPRAANVKRASD